MTHHASLSSSGTLIRRDDERGYNWIPSRRGSIVGQGIDGWGFGWFRLHRDICGRTTSDSVWLPKPSVQGPLFMAWGVESLITSPHMLNEAFIRMSEERRAKPTESEAISEVQISTFQRVLSGFNRPTSRFECLRTNSQPPLLVRTKGGV